MLLFINDIQGVKTYRNDQIFREKLHRAESEKCVYSIFKMVIQSFQTL